MTAPTTMPPPSRLEQLEMWAREHRLTLSAARRRYAQCAVCQAIAASSYLAAELAFKGGNALLFAYGSERSTTDLDFSCASSPADFTVEHVRKELEATLPEAARRSGIRLRVQSAKRDPPSLLADTPTYLFKIAYAFPGEKAFSRWEIIKRDLPSVVVVEIAVNEKICATHTAPSESGIATLQVSDLDDIVAEKLRALLQQVVRNRRRPQDVFDLADLLRRQKALDLARVSAFLVAKALARQIEVSKAAFRDSRVWERAATDYPALRQTVSGAFVEFEEARQAVLALVDKLDLPSDGPLLPEKTATRMDAE